MNRQRYFPSTLVPKLEIVSDFPAVILNKPPSKIPLTSTVNRSMLIQEMYKYWVIPENRDSGTLTIMLRRPAELREILITYAPTVDPRSDPHTLDLRIGYYLDDMKLVYSVKKKKIVNTRLNFYRTFSSIFHIGVFVLHIETSAPDRKSMHRTRVPSTPVRVGHIRRVLQTHRKQRTGVHITLRQTDVPQGRTTAWGCRNSCRAYATSFVWEN